jgi:hypothetical protein
MLARGATFRSVAAPDVYEPFFVLRNWHFGFVFEYCIYVSPNVVNAAYLTFITGITKSLSFFAASTF